MDSLFAQVMAGVLCVYGVMMIACLLRALRGPDMADRVVAINMIGTIVIAAIVILSVLLEESFLIDMALLYAMLNFIATVLLCRNYVGVYRVRKKKEEEKRDE